MSRIRDAFARGKVFIPFVTCGDPDLDTTAAVVKAMADAGAGIVELGVPFSDPTAEGPVIQGANMRALAGGTTTDKILAMAAALRRETDVPLVFMTYANVVFSRTVDGFAERCADAGIDGLILPDVPFEEKEEFAPAFRKRGIDFISLVAPTSAGRIAQIARAAEGFLYVVSSLGVTGTRGTITTDIGAIVRQVRAASNVPCAVGFGISTPEQAARMAALSDGAIVGSAIVKLIAQHGRDAPPVVAAYVRRMATAVRGAP